MEKHLNRLIQGSLFVSALALSACAGSNQGKTSVGAPSTQAPAAQARTGAQKPQGVPSENLRREQDRSSLDALRQGEAADTARDSAMKDVYFDFDRYNLDNDDRATLRASAEWLKRNPSVRVQLEGHCDERGTGEYNLALGAKRAQAAKDYLVSLGVSENRLSTVSYGEEIPVCQDASETCWQKNRRDRFVRSVGAKGTF
ncbi:MAG: peptidoglycan-associated lipoprotein Pal [Candidatus Binatia bacterium]